MNIPLTREQLDKLRGELKAKHGIDISGDNGIAEHDGIRIAYRYDGATLTLDVVKHPWTKPKSIIEGRIEDFIHEVKA